MKVYNAHVTQLDMNGITLGDSLSFMPNSHDIEFTKRMKYIVACTVHSLFQ